MTDRQEIEQPQIDGEALTGIGVSAFTQEAPQRASGDRGARGDGSGATVAVAGAVISNEAVDAADPVLRESVKRHGAFIGTETAERWVRDILATVVPLLRAEVAAELVAHARELQAAIDHPGTDADVMSMLIDESEGLWSAIRIVHEPTWQREAAAIGREAQAEIGADGTGQPTEGVPGEVTA